MNDKTSDIKEESNSIDKKEEDIKNIIKLKPIENKEVRGSNYESLYLYQKIYDSILYMRPILREFPRYEKHSMVATINNTLYDMLRNVARYEKNKNISTMYNVDADAGFINTMVTLAYDSFDIDAMSRKRAIECSERMKEIGSLVGPIVNSGYSEQAKRNKRRVKKDKRRSYYDDNTGKYVPSKEDRRKENNKKTDNKNNHEHVTNISNNDVNDLEKMSTISRTEPIEALIFEGYEHQDW